MSRRTRRAAVQPPSPAAAAVAESPKIVSNPIFRCEPGPSRETSSPPPDQLRCVYRPGSLYALVHDPDAGSGGSGNNGIGMPLPLPPCRAHRAGASGTGSRVPTTRSGPVIVAGGTHGSRVQRRRAPHEHDPFLAAYVACRKTAGGKVAEATDRPQQKRTQGKKKTKTKKATKKRGKEGACGIWAAGAKYAGAMSCRYYGCAVADQEQQQGDAPAAAAKAKSSEAGDDAPARLTLDLSWAPAVLSARARERRLEQR